MRVLVTGAAGFIGAALVERLRADPETQLTLVDLHPLPAWAGDPRLRFVGGSIADPAALEGATATPPDLVFHLASVPGGKAEVEYELGRAVNVGGTEALLGLLRAAGRCPVFVFASSIAALGGPLPDMVDDGTPANPQMSYGAQKLIGEVLVADATRRGWIDGRSLRLCGIVTRPPQRTGATSIFLSDLLRDLPAAWPVTVPMSPAATTWLMSLERCVDNLVHAAGMDTGGNPGRVWTPPPCRTSIAALVEAVGEACGRDVSALVSYRPDPRIEAAFGSAPPFRSVLATRAGLRDDGGLLDLVRRASLVGGEGA